MLILFIADYFIPLLDSQCSIVFSIGSNAQISHRLSANKYEPADCNLCIYDDFSTHIYDTTFTALNVVLIYCRTAISALFSADLTSDIATSLR